MVKSVTVLDSRTEKNLLSEITEKSITLNGENIINRINRQSSFFNLKVGTSTIKYSSEKGYVNIDVNIYFYKKYIGV